MVSFPTHFQYSKIPRIALIGKKLRDHLKVRVGQRVYISIEGNTQEYKVITGYRDPPVIVGTPAFEGTKEVIIRSGKLSAEVNCQYREAYDVLNHYPKTIDQNIIVCNPKVVKELNRHYKINLKYGKKIKLNLKGQVDPEGTEYILKGKRWVNAMISHVDKILHTYYIYFFPTCYNKLQKAKEKVRRSKMKLHVWTEEDEQRNKKQLEGTLKSKQKFRFHPSSDSRFTDFPEDRVKVILGNPDKISTLTLEEVNKLLDDVTPVLQDDTLFIYFKKKKGIILFIGDTHGDFEATKEIYKKFLEDPQNTYLVFIGDMIDRGELDFENINFLFLLKIQYPNNVFLLRGNHEAHSIIGVLPHSFPKSLEEKFGKKIGAEILKRYDRQVFHYLPLMFLTEKHKVLAFHGGVPSPGVLHALMLYTECDHCGPTFEHFKLRSDRNKKCPSCNRDVFSDIYPTLAGKLDEFIAKIRKIDDLDSNAYEDAIWDITWGDLSPSMSGRGSARHNWFNMNIVLGMRDALELKAMIRGHEREEIGKLYDDIILTIMTSSYESRLRYVAGLDLNERFNNAQDLKLYTLKKPN